MHLVGITTLDWNRINGFLQAIELEPLTRKADLTNPPPSPYGVWQTTIVEHVETEPIPCGYTITLLGEVTEHQAVRFSWWNIRSFPLKEYGSYYFLFGEVSDFVRFLKTSGDHKLGIQIYKALVPVANEALKGFRVAGGKILYD